MRSEKRNNVDRSKKERAIIKNEEKVGRKKEGRGMKRSDMSGL